MRLKDLQKIKIPSHPGVYFFRRKDKILYIGKATELKNRVRSYFSADLIGTRGPMITDMVFKADNLRWRSTDSVLEALILEANLIKKYQPYYNVREKDDKSWNYVIITDEKLPKVLIVRERNLLKERKARESFGPFTNGGGLKEALKIIRPIFPFLDGKSANNYQFYKQLGLVPDIESREGMVKYTKDLRNLKNFFLGRKKHVLKALEKEMRTYAKREEFERAGEAKRQIFALRHINDVALIKDDLKFKSEGLFRIEGYDVAHTGGKNIVGVMTVIEGGKANKAEYRKFKIKTLAGADDTGALREVLERRFVHSEWRYPDLLVLDGGVAQLRAGRGVLKKLGIEIPIVSVVKDERHRPRGINGNDELARKYEREILLANSEAHRFAITFHKLRRGKTFLP